MKNPFTPGFGVSPPLLVGRRPLIDAFVDAIESGPGALGRASIYTGARGVGKTVMLNEVQAQARARGWEVIAETTTHRFVDRIINEHLPELLAKHDPHTVKRRMTGATVPVFGGGATWDSADTHVPAMGLRNQAVHLCELLSNKHEGAGLIFTLDEIQMEDANELREFGAALQHLFRESRPVAFAGAGLLHAVNTVLNDRVLAFLRRADRHDLGPVSLGDVAEALRQPIQDQARSISNADCKLAASSTGGYPFMIQLVGDHIWRQHPTAPQITRADVQKGVVAAKRRLGSLLYLPSLTELSDVDRSFLLAMASDPGPSQMKNIAKRLGCDANYAAQYRLRLLGVSLISEAGYGKVDFAVPYLREYLRDHGAVVAQGAIGDLKP